LRCEGIKLRLQILERQCQIGSSVDGLLKRLLLESNLAIHFGYRRERLYDQASSILSETKLTDCTCDSLIIFQIHTLRLQSGANDILDVFDRVCSKCGLSGSIQTVSETQT